MDRFTARAGGPADAAPARPARRRRVRGDPARRRSHVQRRDGLRQRPAGEPRASRSSCDDVVLHVQASIGIATAPLHAHNRGDMLFAADAAMYAAKTSGEPVCFHSPAAVGDRRKRLEVAEDLYAALERHELTVEYQPIVTAEGGLVGAEALVRWDHPDPGPAVARGVPGDGRALQAHPGDRRAGPRRGPRRPGAAGARRRRRPDGLGERLRLRPARRGPGQASSPSALLKHDVPPEALTIEITETAMMRNPELAQTGDAGARRPRRAARGRRLRHRLQQPGVPPQAADQRDQARPGVLRATSSPSSGRPRSSARRSTSPTPSGLRMVAEGVEDEGTLFILRELGCDLVQGWHLGRPMRAARRSRLLVRPGSCRRARSAAR